jgi:nucleoside-triphosphatase THEP1
VLALALATPLTALIYGAGTYPDVLLRDVLALASRSGLHVAGLLQVETSRAQASRCDMELLDAATGRRWNISENRGPHARGCRLDQCVLADALGDLAAQIERQRPALLILNKFGKVEAAGRGLRDILVRAIQLEVPVLIGVPKRNIDSWHVFAGTASHDIELG